VRVTEDVLGAWLIKGNADRTDLAERLRREPRVENWCVQPGYRARMMRAGQPVVLWVSGSRRGVPHGVGGIGRVTGAPAPRSEDARWSVPLDLVAWDPAAWLDRGDLRLDPRLADAEVFRQPQAGNPSFLTVEQFDALRDHVGAVPR
jgi:hypothetical protein